MIPRLVVVTDRAQLRLGRGLVRTVVECVDAGLTHVLVRELDLPPGQRAALIGELAAVDGLTVWSAHTAVRGATGVHVPATGQPPSRGEWGRSCHSRADVAAAAAEGARWATLSPYADSTSKPGRRLLDPGQYADPHLPVLALGGITAANAGDAVAAGAHGVAVMGAVMRAAEPAAVVAQLRAVIP